MSIATSAPGPSPARTSATVPGRMLSAESPSGARARQDHVMRGDAHAQRRARRPAAAAAGTERARRPRVRSARRRDGARHARSSTAPASRAPSGQDGRVAQHLGRWAPAPRPGRLQRDHRGGEPRDLGRRMADIEDRDRDLVAQPLEVGQDLGLARLVERGERLVGEDQPRRRQKRAPDRDALLLAARERAGAAVEQGADARAARRRGPCPPAAPASARTSAP